MEELYQKEQDLLGLLNSKSAEADRLRISYETASTEIDALSRELLSVRENILLEFFQAELSSRNLTALFFKENDETYANIIAQAGGELELDKLKSSLEISTTERIPITYLANYFGKGLPYSITL